MKSRLALVFHLFFTLAGFGQAQDSAAFYLQKGNEASNSRLYMVASKAYLQSISYDSSNPDTYRELGKVYVEMRHYPEAIVAFRKVQKLAPKDSSATRNLAMLYYSTRRWEDAIKYAKIMQEEHMAGNAEYILGQSYTELEDYGQAYPHLQAALKTDTGNAQIYYTIARNFVEMSNYRSAAPFFVKAIAHDTTNARWVYETALSYAAIPDDKNAITYYELAARRGYKMDNEFFENISISYEATGQLDKCIETLKTLLQKKPADLELLNGVAYAEYKAKRYQDAIDHWDMILSYDKQNAKALYMIGIAYQKKGDKEKGAQLCDQAIKMDPSLANLKQQKSQPGL